MAINIERTSLGATTGVYFAAIHGTEKIVAKKFLNIADYGMAARTESAP